MSLTPEEQQVLNGNKNSSPKSKANSDRTHHQNAGESATALAASYDKLRSVNEGNLKNVAALIQQVSSQRDGVKNKASDAIAYLYDPNIFLAEVFDDATHKLENHLNTAQEVMQVPFVEFGFQLPALDFSASHRSLPGSLQ